MTPDIARQRQELYINEVIFGMAEQMVTLKREVAYLSKWRKFLRWFK